MSPFTRLTCHPWGLVSLGLLLLGNLDPVVAIPTRGARDRVANVAAAETRERISLNEDWTFSRFTTNPDSLSYDTLKSWILPSGNDFISGTKHQTPTEPPPGDDVEYISPDFDDSEWEAVNLPHDWAIKGPFNAPGISGGMGRLPSNGVGWYRKSLTIAPEDMGRTIFLDIDGAMSYSAVWLNGNLLGGWPYGYNSFRLDLTPYLEEGANQLAIRLENALDSSRWYPGAGIYRNVWLVKVNPVHVSQYGTYITTPTVSAESAIVDLAVEVENMGNDSREVVVETKFYALSPATGEPGGDVVATVPAKSVTMANATKQTVNGSTTVENPLLWGPAPAQTPNLYVAVTTLTTDNATTIDSYETRFGIRSVTYDPDEGVLINGQPVRVQGVCNHHDLGSIGAAFNFRAAERQFEILQEMGTNALRTSHNPPAPEILDIADNVGFMVYDEIFDVWDIEKVTNDGHLIFEDWKEPDLRSFIRRDRNHPSIIAWGFGNELPEQSTAAGGETARSLRAIIVDEDPTRPTTAGMNSAAANTTLADVLDLEGLNYQGEGRGTSWDSTFPSFHSAHPEKVIWSSESSSALSTRGTYIFPVTPDKNAVVGDLSGGDPEALQVSAYELYAPSWGSSPDKVFEQQDRHSFVAGEFVWTGFDYIGEPTPYDDTARSSYFGIVDMAGFKKDRYYLYQSRWRADYPMAHILPHWTWPDRVGEVTPVHVFSSADEAELFVNGESAGRKEKAAHDSRFRWDDVVYQAGNLSVVTYKEGKEWATDTKRTVGAAAKLVLTADRTDITADGYDLSFVTVAVVDANGDTVPQANNTIKFSLAGPGQIVSTDNGNPADFTVFPSPSRDAFGGLALAIVRADAGASGEITISAASTGLTGASAILSIS